MRRLWFIFAFALASCGAPQEGAQQDPEMLGTPPTPGEDPFFYIARPPVDARADATGTIGEGSRKKRQKQRVKAAAGNVQAALSALDDAESENFELRAQNVELRGKLADKRADPRSRLAQCHSCVRLCPIKGKCADDAELVCGWGTGKRRKNAILRATTECDSALQSLRGSAFSRIEGNCPIAKCQ